MGRVNINFNNVGDKITELKDFTQQNLVIKVENEYKELAVILDEAEGIVKNELVNALDKEKNAILSFVSYMKEVYILIQKSSNEFESVDKQHANKVKK